MTSNVAIEKKIRDLHKTCLKSLFSLGKIFSISMIIIICKLMMRLLFCEREQCWDFRNCFDFRNRLKSKLNIDNEGKNDLFNVTSSNSGQPL